MRPALPTLAFGSLRAPRRLLLAVPVLLAAFGAAELLLQSSATAQQGRMAPRFEVDPFWPKPLPAGQILGPAIGIGVDARDHVWIVHRNDRGFAERTEIGLATNPPTAEHCCRPAAPVLHFDPAGNLVGSFGGKGAGYDWPESNHGIAIDHKGNLWIGGNGDGDSHILKFTQDGKLIAQFGRPKARLAQKDSDPNTEGDQVVWAGNSLDTESFGRVAKIFIDPKANEAYVADGYLNKRVAVIDADTGKFKRYWGAYGNKPDDASLGPYDPSAPPAKQFRNPVHCVELASDGLLYVCDRQNDRIQVFKADGTFVKETFIAKRTLGDGSVWDIALSRDPAQQFLYVADGKNERIHVLERASLELLTSFGDGGRQPGQFFGVHSIATDSQGNIYTTETYEGKRLQKFVFKGLAPVTGPHQGVPWPKQEG